MAPSKLTILIPLTLLMLGGASAAPVASPANVPGGAVPGGVVPVPEPQRRGYDGDWLYSRESDLETALKPTYTIPEKKISVVNGEVQVAEKRGYDGDWLYSRRSAKSKESGVDAEK